MKRELTLCAVLLLSTPADAKPIRSLIAVELESGKPGINGGNGLLRLLPRANREYNLQSGSKAGPVFVPLGTVEQHQLRAISDFLSGASDNLGVDLTLSTVPPGYVEDGLVSATGLRASFASACKVVDTESISFAEDKPASFGIIGFECHHPDGVQQQFISVKFEPGKLVLLHPARWVWVALSPDEQQSPPRPN